MSVPVIALTGFLGAGKTTLLNHVLSTPQARIGVVINDFGDINVDAQLVTGQIDEPASIAGGCICCVADDGELDQALAKLADPRLNLDAIIVEASGVADPVAIARMVGFSGVERIRSGGVVDVIDAVSHFDTVDQGGLPPARYGAAGLVVVTKLDLISDANRDAAFDRIRDRVHESNPEAVVIAANRGRIDPSLLFDISDTGELTGQLSFRDLLYETAAETHAAEHVHADAVTVTGTGAVGIEALLDLLEAPPPGVYRLKGTVSVRQQRSARHVLVNVVGRTVHISAAPPGADEPALVAIGLHLDTDAVRTALETALQPSDSAPSEQLMRRWRRYF